MKRALLLTGLLGTGCVTPMSSEVTTLEHTLAGRSADFSNVQLPRFDAPEDVPADVEELLQKPLTIEDAVKVSLLANRDARAALAEVGMSKGAFLQASLLPNPEAEFSLRDPGGPQPAQLDFGLELNLAGTFLTPVRAGIGEATLQAERLRAAGLLLDLAYRTRLAWLEAQAAAAKLDLRTRAFEAQQASWEAVTQLERAGNTTGLQVANERAAVELARVQVAEAESALLDAKELLMRRLGLKSAQLGFSLAGQLELQPLPQAGALTEGKAITASLELAELLARAEAASRKVGLAKTEGWLPHLTAGFHGQRDANLWELGGHIAVGLPLLDQAQGRQLTARSEYDVMRARAESQALAVRSAVRMTLNRLESATKRAMHHRDRLVPARQAALKETVLQYNAMQLGVFQVLAAQRAVTEATLAQVDATLEAGRAHAALELLLAGRSTPLELGMISSSTMSASGGGDAH